MTNEAEITLQTSFSLLTFKDNKNNFTNNFSFKLKLEKKKHKQIMFASQY
jgi:hypothetical protein